MTKEQVNTIIINELKSKGIFIGSISLEVLNAFANIMYKAINDTHCCGKLPNIESEVFRKWYLSDGYNETMNNHILCKNGFDYDKEIVFKHYCNLTEFGN